MKYFPVSKINEETFPIQDVEEKYLPLEVNQFFKFKVARLYKDIWW
jgi:hypothetical protein